MIAMDSLLLYCCFSHHSHTSILVALCHQLLENLNGGSHLFQTFLEPSLVFFCYDWSDAHSIFFSCINADKDTINIAGGMWKFCLLNLSQSLILEHKLILKTSNTWICWVILPSLGFFIRDKLTQIFTDHLSLKCLVEKTPRPLSLTCFTYENGKQLRAHRHIATLIYRMLTSSPSSFLDFGFIITSSSLSLCI